MIRIFQLLLVFSSIFYLNGCVPSSKLYFFHDQQPTTQRLDSMDQGQLNRIQVADRLVINVSSPEPGLTAFLNPFNAQNTGNTNQLFNNGYLVNDKGFIFFPYIGEIKVEGLTTSEASTLIRSKLSVFYKDIFVNVNMAGRIYFINGRSGTAIPILNERLTIFEAIAQSGTQDAFDKKNQVVLVREEKGERTIAKLDLNSKSIFQSPYFYLKNNDLVYLQPGRVTTFLSPGSPARNVITITGAALTVLIALNNIIR